MEKKEKRMSNFMPNAVNHSMLKAKDNHEKMIKYLIEVQKIQRENTDKSIWVHTNTEYGYLSFINVSVMNTTADNNVDFYLHDNYNELDDKLSNLKDIVKQ